MEQRRFLLFISLSLLIWIGWMNLMQRWFPPPVQPLKPEVAAKLGDEDGPPADALDAVSAPAALPERVGVPKFPERKVTLGSSKADSKFYLNVQLTSLGAAIDFIELNDPRYRDFNDRKQPLKVVGSDPKAAARYRTFATAIPALDDQLPPGGNQQLNWEVVPETLSDSVAEFRLVAPDGRFEVVKRYELKQPDPQSALLPKARDELPEGYELVLSVTIRNRQPEAAQIDYVLQGPVGLPLEDAENSSKYRDIRMGFLEPNGSVTNGQMTAVTVIDNELGQKVVDWPKPLKYIGVDVKYFAGLVVPLGDQLKAPTVTSSRAQVVTADLEKQLSDISVLLHAQADLDKAGENGSTVEQSFLLFTGPKRQSLLQGVSAEAIVDFGYVDAIARIMLTILNFFVSLGANYGVAIILLTVAVRLAMFPVSRHQARNMQRMKDLQPKIKELQQKYAGNKEELARAQMELFRKHNYNPLSGCLPMFLQLPIFIGLYTAISSSVDLRMARFLWIDNLASPDALFPLPFQLPYIPLFGAKLFGWKDFNLLPILSAGLMFVQQKMMMPPPADEEQAMQHRMMNFMSLFIGVMFYRVPAGLCLYFVVSSVWGMVERWTLNFLAKSHPPAPTAADGSGKTETPEDRGAGPGGRLGDLWNRLQSAADKDVSITRTNGDGKTGQNRKKKKR